MSELDAVHDEVAKELLKENKKLREENYTLRERVKILTKTVQAFSDAEEKEGK